MVTPNENNDVRPRFDEYIDWHRDQFLDDLEDGRAEDWYDRETTVGKAALARSQFWQNLGSELSVWDRDYARSHDDYGLLENLGLPEIDIKSLSSTLNKTYRWNIFDNPKWPHPPEDRPSTAPDSDDTPEDSPDVWYGPNNWLTDFPDIFRTRFVTRYFDGVRYLAERIEELANRTSNRESVLRLRASQDGYHAAHVWVYHNFSSADYQTNNTSPIQARFEIQVTTSIQEMIGRLLHNVYEDWRLNGRPQDWQWDHTNSAFSVNYLGNTLHYLEGMIVNARDQRRVN